uniref:Glucose-6-phosphate isomerase n=1 Tax=uncultured Mycoplasmataceae bacterium TaxID=300027 RepID=A0A6G9HGQ5_9MOLU|nr:glucose-6-phosphate isomerase [uncultured Mycoplasmataceae bacterium]
MLKFVTSNAIQISESAIQKKYQKEVDKIQRQMMSSTLPGLEKLGWVNIIDYYSNQQLLAMKKKAQQWKKQNLKYVLVIGIGGSYLGVRAAIEMVQGSIGFGHHKFIYIHNMSSSYIYDVIKKIGKNKFSIIVISKSGTTIEPAVTFRIFKEIMCKNFGKEYCQKMIVAITDSCSGTLHKLAKANKWTMFYIPDDIGGRYSTLTPVGMFPMVLAGLDPLEVLKGAKKALDDTKTFSLKSNSAFLYACYRHYFHVVKKLQIENFIVYDPSLTMIGEQWKQLFGESEGKSHKAMYPTVSLFTTDLHALGQYLQQGTRNFCETTLWVDEPRKDFKLSINDNTDGLKYLDKKTLNYINEQAFKGTVLAHTKNGKTNNLIIHITRCDSYHYGYLYIWLCRAAMMSGYLLKINPFDQPGVEAYKTNMFSLLKRK